MHPNFADWYREASIDPGGVPLDLRWKGLASATETAPSRPEVASLASWLYSVDPHPGTPGRLREHFKEHDNTFSMRGNDQEMSVLAAAALIERFRTRRAHALEALAVVNAARILGDPTVVDVVAFAGEWLRNQSVESRQVPRPPKRVRLEEWTNAKAELSNLKQLTDPINAGQLYAKLDKLVGATEQSIVRLRTTCNQLLDYSSKADAVRSEEGELYWWLLRRTRQGSEESPAKYAHRLARELTELTTFDVEHPSAKAFLEHILGLSEEEITLKQIRAELTAGDEESAGQGPPSAPFQMVPLLHLSRGLQPPTGFEGRIGRDSKLKFSLADAGRALHRELITERHWSAA